jgi:uncharacterized protein YbgA (DUF1722 family)/uncharacterized protein YbbK (DUF523 family)
MKELVKPIVVVSKCIEFEACRYNGLGISSPIVRNLQKFLKFIPVCPEVEIGLGIPREAVRLVDDDGIKLVNSMTGEDHTAEMTGFADEFLNSLEEIDGFILKSRSPSCGIKDVKLYKGTGKLPAMSSKSVGLFGNAVLEKFNSLAIEEEGRLTNLHIREHFLSKLYTFAKFRQLPVIMRELIKFHSNNKYLFMSYNQSQLKIAGKIVANHEKLPVEEVFGKYKEVLYKIFQKNARISTNINVLMHLLGYFSDSLTSQEKIHFLDQLSLYRSKQIPLIAITTILRSWVLRFGQEYLFDQTYFAPFPPELMHITDSGKGRIIK